MGRGSENKKKRGLTMVQSCYYCKGHVVQQSTTIDYRWGDSLFVIRDVPAGVCQQCGEKYLNSDVNKELERLATKRDHLKESINIDVLSYADKAAA